MKNYIILALFSVFFIACGDSNTTVTAKNCSNSCDTEWQVCNEDTQKCDPKDGKCDDDDICTDNTMPKCNLVTHVCVEDKCSNAPCDANTENANTNCNLDDSTEGFSCICEEGFDFDDNDKCVEVVVDPCEPNPCTDNAEGKTICKVDDTATDGFVCEAPVVDACTDEPCANNAEGKTVCKVDDTATDGFVCEAPIVLDPCEALPCANNTDGKTVCKVDDTVADGYICEAPVVDACTDEPCANNNDGQTLCTLSDSNTDGFLCSCEAGLELVNGVCTPTCTNTCNRLGATKCNGDRLDECVADDTTYCTVWEEQKDCGANQCIQSNNGEAYCECEQCDPAAFNSVCSTDVKSYEFCEETVDADNNSCFKIETVTCDAGKHCEADNAGALSCEDNVCVNAVECTSEDFTRCAISGDASILQGCEYNVDGCLELYTIDNCTVKNMMCQEYDSTLQCLGGNGTDKCQTADANADAEVILSSGYWVGDTSSYEDEYQGCNNNFDGNDAVYAIDLLTGNKLELVLKQINAGTLGDITPSIYITMGCNAIGASDTCKEATAGNNEKAKLTFRALSDGKYYIFIDRKKDNDGIMPDLTNGYEFELTVNLQ